MKKYFFKESGKEVKFGDMITLDLSEELPNGNVKYRHLDCKFVPGIAQYLIDEDIIEVEDTEDTEENEEKWEGLHLNLDNEDNEILNDLINDVANLDDRLVKLEEKVDKFMDMHKDFVALTSNMFDTFKEAIRDLPEKKTAQTKKK